MFGLLGGLVSGLGNVAKGIGGMFGGGSGPLSGLSNIGSSLGSLPGRMTPPGASAGSVGAPTPSSQFAMQPLHPTMPAATNASNISPMQSPEPMPSPQQPASQPLSVSDNPSAMSAAPMSKSDQLRSMIAEKAKQLNSPLSPEFYDKMAQIESGFDPSAVSGNGAKGLFQFTNNTWKAYGSGNPLDPAANIEAGIKYSDSNYEYLSSKLGRPAQPYEVYMAHNLGPGGAMRLIHSDPNMQVSERLIGSNPAYNPSFLMGNDGPLTAGQAVQRYRSTFMGGN